MQPSVHFYQCPIFTVYTYYVSLNIADAIYISLYTFYSVVSRTVFFILLYNYFVDAFLRSLYILLQCSTANNLLIPSYTFYSVICYLYNCFADAIFVHCTFYYSVVLQGILLVSLYTFYSIAHVVVLDTADVIYDFICIL
jgi:hypothetical protein